MTTFNLLDEADRLYQSGQYADATRTYQEARALRRDAAFQAFIDLNVAQCLRRQGHKQEALDYAARGLARVSEHAALPTRGELLVTYGNCLADIGQHDQALKAFSDATDLFKCVGDERGLQQAEVCKSRSLIRVGETAAAHAILVRLLRRPDLSPLVESQALTNLAVIEGERGDISAARGLYQRDLELHARLDDQYGRAVTLLNLAQLEAKQGDGATARILLQSARVAAQHVNATELSARAELLLQDDIP